MKSKIKMKKKKKKNEAKRKEKKKHRTNASPSIVESRRCRCIPGVPPLDYHSGTHCSTTFLSLSLSLCVSAAAGWLLLCFGVVVKYTHKQRRSRNSRNLPGENVPQLGEKNKHGRRGRVTKEIKRNKFNLIKSNLITKLNLHVKCFLLTIGKKSKRFLFFYYF
jgi:hypothetical protein